MIIRAEAAAGIRGEIAAPAIVPAEGNVSEACRAAHTNEFLVDLGSALGASLDADRMVRDFARLCAHQFASCCVVAVDKTDTHPPLVEAAHGDAACSGGPGQHAAHATQITVPIRIRGKRVGVLTLSSTRYQQDGEMALAERAAERLAAALDNANLYATAMHSLRAHDEMLSFVSHDLRNPLNVITMAADFLRERAAGDDVALHWLDAILQAADRMNMLITDLLTDARTRAEGPALRRHPVAAGHLIREAFNAHEAAVERKNLCVTFALADDTLHVKADARAVVRALSNLIGNAVKYTPADGAITISASAADDSTVEFCVTDTGPGIAEDFIPHVFERFWQVPNTRSGGTGLGLAIVKSVIETHGGRVWVESRLGAGSAFHFTLPAAPSTELAAAGHM
jgi:signal transduction histidine kinase